MYMESPSHEDDQVTLLENSNNPRTRVAVGLAVVACAAIGLVGTSFLKSESLLSSTSQSVNLDLVDTEVQIQMDMVGPRYSDMTANAWGAVVGPVTVPAAPTKTKCDLKGATYAAAPAETVNEARDVVFQLVLQNAVSRKAKVEYTDVKFRTSPSSGQNPDRTEATVVLEVPSTLSTSAVMSRLNEGGTLLTDIKDLLISCNLADAAAEVHSVMQSRQGESTVMETTHRQGSPDINLALEIKGLYYTELSLSESLKTAFVNAVRTGIVPDGYKLDANSIALDIQNAGQNDQKVPFVNVQATFPVPAGLTADATMSKWPGGRAKIGQAVTANLKAIPDIKQAARDRSSTLVHEIVVLPGALRLGGIRATYATEVTFHLDIENLDHDQSLATDPKFSVIRDQVKASLKALVGKDDVDVAFFNDDRTKEVEEPTAATDPSIADLEGWTTLKLRVTVSHGEGPTVNLKDAAAWEAKLIPAVRSAETFFKKSYATAANDDDYGFLMHVPKLSNQVSSVDLDLVVNGIDYRSLRPETKGVFLTDLAKAVRDGLDHAGTGPIHANKDKIKVLVSAQSSTGAVNVRAQIPAPQDPAELYVLEKKLAKEAMDGTMKTEMEESVQGIKGIAYASTWTKSAIAVSVPGHINDFSGDLVGSADEI